MKKLEFGELPTLKKFKEDYLNGKRTLMEDEYLKNGLPYCKRCNTARFGLFDFEGENCCGYTNLCECNKIEYEKEKEEERKLTVIAKFKERKNLSMLGKKYENAIFENAIITKNNRTAFDKAKHYVKNSDAAFVQNIGLYFYGDNSSGKTFLSACMCNALLEKGHSCIFTNLATILNEIKANFNTTNGESEILGKMRTYRFLFIDDLGKEFIGREFNVTSSKWAEQKLFEIINTRYNAGKPIIFSSNYSIGELQSKLGLDKAILERINEMATRVIKLEGEDFRARLLDEKDKIAESLGI